MLQKSFPTRGRSSSQHRDVAPISLSGLGHSPKSPFLRKGVSLLVLALISVASVGTASFIPSTATATLLPQYTLEQLADEADAIVTATVEKTVPYDAGGYISTDTTMRVDLVLKGKVDPTILLRQRGGRLGNLATYVPGMPSYQVGERVLVFLESKPNGRFVTAAFSQGKLPIRIKDGSPYVVLSQQFYGSIPSIAGDPPYASSTAIVDPDEPAHTTLVPLNDVLSAIKKALATP